MTIGLWSYTDAPVVHEQGRLSAAVPATPAGVLPSVSPGGHSRHGRVHTRGADFRWRIVQTPGGMCPRC